ncbi:MAG TPA: hypothetical protein VLX44_17000 [Xanthobacteraceae bacterium]|nr:hypothetical protein [Xanthobacteraceae bacterium]
MNDWFADEEVPYMTRKRAHLAFFMFLLSAVEGQAQDQWPETLVRQMECLKQHGLIQGTVTDVIRGDAHFAPYMRPTAIGGAVPAIRFNGQFVEGRTNLSPDIIKICNPNAELRKIKN